MKKKTSKSTIYPLSVTLKGKKYSKVFLSLRKRLTFLPVKNFIQKKPYLSFITVLILLALLVISGSYIFPPKPIEEKRGDNIKEVEVFNIGEAPRIEVQGFVEKSGIVKLVAQTPGIVSSVNVYEGQQVNKGQVLINLSSNYLGGNALSVSRQIAQAQFNLSKETFESQKEIIKRQREVAEKTDANSDELRDIQTKSIGDTRSLLDLNESLLSTLNQNLTQYEATNSAGVNSQLIFQTNIQKAQFQSVIGQLKTQIRNLEYQSASDKPPAQLADLGREITLRQLELQEKSLEVNKRITELSYTLALINESSMFPAAPFNGVVQKVHVRFGQSVSPGTVLLTLSATEDDVTIDARVPKNIADNISRFEKSRILVNGELLEAEPFYISTEATSGQLYSVIYVLDDSYKNLFTDGSFVNIEIPIGVSDTNPIIPFIPIDSVFQTQEESYVFVVEEDKAKVKKVNLGEVKGGFVSILEGLSGDERIILNRNTVEGDTIKVRN